ncbi:MAG: NUDIX hydrolase [Candidatus Gastranaerophilales bacterium]
MNFEEKTLKSEIVYQGKIIRVYRDEIELSNGMKSFREVAQLSGGVVILAIKEDEILFVQQYRYPIKNTIFELPAGKLEKDEAPLNAAKRELEEETGYQAKNWKSLGFINPSAGFCDEVLHLYLAQDLTFTKQHPDEGEIIEASTIKIKKVLEMIQNGEINDAKTICAISRTIIDGVIKL